MAHSTKATKPAKPRKPHPDFPLFPHASGRWAKKVRGRFCYFGKVADDPEGAAALLLWLDQKDDLLAGRAPQAREGTTIKDLCNAFLTAKDRRVESGELSRQSFADYFNTAERLIAFFGKQRLVDDLRPDDFERFRATLAKKYSVVTLRNEINRCHIVFRYAHTERLIDKPVHFGQSFARPSAKMLRAARNEAGIRMFEADELRCILDAADPVMRAMILLALNCGFGNTDVSMLPQSAVDLKAGWVVFPRPKTAITRRVPLWRETRDALKVAIEMRPVPKDAADEGLCFITVQGNSWVRVKPSASSPDKVTTVNTVAGNFGSLLRRLHINGRKGLGFYTLRHVFETIAGDSRDQVAVNAIMGHVDTSMGATYRERIEDARLKAVTNHVRKWLWPRGTKGVNKPRAK